MTSVSTDGRTRAFAALDELEAALGEAPRGLVTAMCERRAISLRGLLGSVFQDVPASEIVPPVSAGLYLDVVAKRRRKTKTKPKAKTAQ